MSKPRILIEALPGVANFFHPSGSATSFPSNVAAGACWNSEPVQPEATAFSEE